MSNILKSLIFLTLVLSLYLPLQAQCFTIRDFYREQGVMPKEGIPDSIISLLPLLKGEQSRYLTYVRNINNKEDIIRGSLYLYHPNKIRVEKDEKGDTLRMFINMDICDTLSYIYACGDSIFIVLDKEGECSNIESDYTVIYVFDKSMVLTAIFKFSYPDDNYTVMNTSLYRMLSNKFEGSKEGNTTGKSCYDYTIAQLFELVRMKIGDRDNSARQWQRSIIPCNTILNAFCSCCHEKR